MASFEWMPQYRGGSGEPLVLINGGINTWMSWEPQLPLLVDLFDVLAPTIRGNVGAPPLPPGRLDVGVWTDGVESAMDAAGFDTAHLAGYSAGGWIAMELLRRGRARTVYAFAPAGGWTTQRSLDRIARIFAAAAFASRASRHLAPVLTRSAWFRRMAVRASNAHGDRMPPAAMTRLFHEIAQSELPGALSSGRMSFEPLDPYPDRGVPVTITWPERDRLLPVEWYAQAWREAVPFAHWESMADVGHMPTYDAPELIARGIVASIERA